MAAYADKPPRYDYDDRLVVDTLYDLRLRARKHVRRFGYSYPIELHIDIER